MKTLRSRINGKKLPIKYLPSASQDITDIIEQVFVDTLQLS